jgi:hypothetical protein
MTKATDVGSSAVHEVLLLDLKVGVCGAIGPIFFS